MNPTSIIALLLMLAEHAPAITAEGIQIYADIAHGPGGLQKVAKVIGDLNAVVASAAGVAAPVVVPPAS